MAGAIISQQKVAKNRGLKRLTSTFVPAAGVVSAHDIGSAFGRIVACAYDANDMDTGTDITLSDKETGAPILVVTNAGTADLYFRPTAVVTANTGVAISAAATAVDINRDIYVCGELRLAIAGGGAGTSGAFTVIVDEG